MNQDQLRRKHAAVQQQYEELCKEITKLRQNLAIATESPEQTMLQQQIDAAETARTQVAQELAAIEQQLRPDDAPPGITAPIVTDSAVEVEALIELQHGGEPIFPLERPEGSMRPDSPFYIERPGDRTAVEMIQRQVQGMIITIKGPPQVGKSSMLSRIIRAAQEAGKRVILLDLQQVATAARTDAATFLRQFCCRIMEVTGLKDLDQQLDTHWNAPVTAVQRCTSFIQQEVLARLPQPLVLALDHSESLLDTPCCRDFFGMLHSWHTHRATTLIWHKLDLLLVTSIEPAQLVSGPDQSPFEASTLIEVTDFTSEQVALLNRRHGMPFSSGEERQLVSLLNGHPYLTRWALYLVAAREQRMTPADIFVDATYDTGPFGEHLQHTLLQLREQPELIAGMRQVLKNQHCDEQLFFRLRGVGLVRRNGQAVLPRCQLYRDYFQERL